MSSKKSKKPKPVDGVCCACQYSKADETHCPKRSDGVHCVHWWDGPSGPDDPPKPQRKSVVATKRAFDQIARAIRDDSGYRAAWTSNIAVLIKDHLRRSLNELTLLLDKSIGEGAEAFVDMLVMKGGGKRRKLAKCCGTCAFWGCENDPQVKTWRLAGQGGKKRPCTVLPIPQGLRPMFGRSEGATCSAYMGGR
jgi:hypothetical protein